MNNFIINKICKAITGEISGIISFIVDFYPNTWIGLKIRECYYRRKLNGNLGEKPHITQMAKIFYDAKIKIGNNFLIGRNSILDPNDSFGIIIGSYVAIASGVFIRAANHEYADIEKPFILQGHLAKKIKSAEGEEASIIIEDDVWIAANCIILTGTKIGKGSIIGAGSLVTGNIPPYSIVTNVPARVIGSRKLSLFSRNYYKIP